MIKTDANNHIYTEDNKMDINYELYKVFYYVATSLKLL